MESYQEACPDQVEGFKKEVKWLNARLTQELEDQYKEDVKVQHHHSNLSSVMIGEISFPLF